MADGGCPAKFRLAGNRLTVRGDLGPDDEKAYSEKLFELLKTGKQELEIDLRGLSRVSSAYVGSTSLLALIANQKRRKVAVLANEDVARILKISGVHQIATVVVPD
jgi:anti-anti-sigma regulatory factor